MGHPARAASIFLISIFFSIFRGLSADGKKEIEKIQALLLLEAIFLEFQQFIKSLHFKVQNRPVLKGLPSIPGSTSRLGFSCKNPGFESDFLNFLKFS